MESNSHLSTLEGSAESPSVPRSRLQHSSPSSWPKSLLNPAISCSSDSTSSKRGLQLRTCLAEASPEGGLCTPSESNIPAHLLVEVVEEGVHCWAIPGTETYALLE